MPLKIKQLTYPSTHFFWGWKKVKVAQLCQILCNSMDYSPWNSPNQNTGMGSLSLLQGIFPTQVSPSSLALQADSLPVRPQGKPKKVSFLIAQLVKAASLIAQLVKKENPPAMQETLVRFLGRSAGGGIGYPLQFSWASLVSQLVKNLPANAGHLSSIPGLGKSPGEGKGYPLQYSALDNSMDCI